MGPMTAPAAASGSFQAVEKLKSKQNQTPEEVGALVEGMFWRILLKQVEEEEADPLFDSEQMRTVKQMYFDEMAHVMGQKGEFGIEELLTADMEKHTGEGSQLPGFVKDRSEG